MTSDSASSQRVKFRPHKAVWIACAGAAVILGAATPMTVFLRQSDTGVNFYISDQVALGAVGLILAGAVLMLARPRVWADAQGVYVRNVLFSRGFDWTDILGVSFPDGASFARLELPQDEYYSVLAVQAMDRGHAVDAVRTLRRLHKQAVRAQGTDSAPEPAPQTEPESDGP